MATSNRDPNPLRARIRPGERLLWEGQPTRSHRAGGSALLVIGLSVVLAFLASVPLVIAAGLFLAAGAPAVLVFVALPIVVVIAAGVRAALRRGTGRGWRLDRAFYAVTDQRVLIQTGGFSSRYVEMDLDNLPPAVLSEDRTGVATIFFGQPPPEGSGGAAWAGTRFPPAFYSIERPEEVFRIIGEARRARTAR